jgi:hypothetical protein
MKRLCLMLLLATLLPAASRTLLVEADVAYAEPMQFDYDRDGKMNEVQMWATVRIYRTDKGYEGYLRRYMKDIHSGEPVLGYADINMLPDRPYGEEIPVTEVQHKGRTVLFKAGSKSYILVDGGEGYENDTVIANDGNRDYLVELYDGDVKVHNR